MLVPSSPRSESFQTGRLLGFLVPTAIISRGHEKGSVSESSPTPSGAPCHGNELLVAIEPWPKKGFELALIPRPRLQNPATVRSSGFLLFGRTDLASRDPLCNTPLFLGKNFLSGMHNRRVCDSGYNPGFDRRVKQRVI